MYPPLPLDARLISILCLYLFFLFEGCTIIYVFSYLKDTLKSHHYFSIWMWIMISSCLWKRVHHDIIFSFDFEECIMTFFSLKIHLDILSLLISSISLLYFYDESWSVIHHILIPADWNDFKIGPKWIRWITLFLSMVIGFFKSQATMAFSWCSFGPPLEEKANRLISIVVCFRRPRISLSF